MIWFIALAIELSIFFCHKFSTDTHSKGNFGDPAFLTEHATYSAFGRSVLVNKLKRLVSET
ncbi:unannotated protein [freshwater metagenome]|uniref:Unannotated protein n=1 Tax=freshwater metagenome TaxID=449393 RepID=A0A6J6XM79_9ZZZZ